MKPIKNYEGIYTISESGEVFGREGNKRVQGIHRGGYRQVSLFKNKGVEIFYVHRLVAQAYIPNPLGLPVVNHIDGNPANNHVSNLEWATQGDNIRKAMAKKGNWLAKAPRKKVPVRSISVKTGEVATHESIAAAVVYVSKAQVATGGDPVTYQKVASNISVASRRGGQSYGFIWGRGNIDISVGVIG
jgi:hypothetical protein